MVRKTTACLLVLLVVGALAGPAFGATAEPSLIGQAWYWEPQQNENFDTPIGSVAGEAPNPYCPGAPGALGSQPEVCAEGRLPVEVTQGDYETPDKVSAFAFDMTMMTVGSKVQSFTIQLLEAESGCREQPDAPTGQQCEETDARNIEDKVVQACEVTEIFGDGDARVYKEMPKFTCTDADPVGKRKEIENDAKTDPNDPDPDHLWTFDLTALAERWAQTPPLCTCIMLRPQKPKEASDQTDNWRVIFAGPKFEGGVKTELKFTPGEGESLPPLPTGPTTTSPTGTGSSSGSLGPTTTVGGGLDPGTSDDPAGDPGGTAPSDPAAADDPLDAGETEQASDVQEVEAMPGYVWLAILAGLIGFSLVRSVILESVTGRRPNGVLAQIHHINEARGSAAVASAAAASGPLSALRSGFGSIKHALSPIGSRVSSIAGKVKGIGKG